eukprot:75877-Amphidinium_carterae.1
MFYSVLQPFWSETLHSFNPRAVVHWTCNDGNLEYQCVLDGVPVVAVCMTESHCEANHALQVVARRFRSVPGFQKLKETLVEVLMSESALIRLCAPALPAECSGPCRPKEVAFIKRHSRSCWGRLRQGFHQRPKPRHCGIC